MTTSVPPQKMLPRMETCCPGRGSARTCLLSSRLDTVRTRIPFQACCTTRRVSLGRHTALPAWPKDYKGRGKQGQNVCPPVNIHRNQMKRKIKTVRRAGPLPSRYQSPNIRPRYFPWEIKNATVSWINVLEKIIIQPICPKSLPKVVTRLSKNRGLPEKSGTVRR